MSQPEKYDLVVLGSGEGGKFIAWSLGSQGKRSLAVAPSGSCGAHKFSFSGFLITFHYNVRGHADPFSISPCPIIGVSPLTSLTVGRFVGHVRMDNREITQQANLHVVRL